MLHNRKLVLSWVFIYALLLLTTLSPLVVITITFLMIPVVILFVKQDTPRFILTYGGCLFVIFLLSSLLGLSSLGIALVVISLFFLAPAIVMGRFYKKQSSARTVVTAGIVSMLIQQLLIIVGLSLFGINVVKAAKQFMVEGFQNVPEALRSQLSKEVIEYTIQTMTMMLPVFMIAFSFYYIVITHWLGRKLLIRTGEQLPAFKPIREWMLPKSFVWYYLIAILLDYVFNEDSDSMVSMILVNLIPLLMFTFAIQAIAFLAFIAHRKRWSSALPIGVFIVMLLFPPLINLLALLGVFDVAFPIRERMRNQS